MDLYNRWSMRASGERQHQPRDAGEQVAYLLMTALARRKNDEPSLQSMTPVDYNHLMTDCAITINELIRSEQARRARLQHRRSWKAWLRSLFRI